MVMVRPPSASSRMVRRPTATTSWVVMISTQTGVESTGWDVVMTSPLRRSESRPEGPPRCPGSSRVALYTPPARIRGPGSAAANVEPPGTCRALRADASSTVGPSARYVSSPPLSFQRSSNVCVVTCPRHVPDPARRQHGRHLLRGPVRRAGRQDGQRAGPALGEVRRPQRHRQPTGRGRTPGSSSTATPTASRCSPAWPRRSPTPAGCPTT